MSRGALLLLLSGCFDSIAGTPPDVGADATDAGRCLEFVADCDRNGSCETDLTRSETCGSCTNACLLGQTCSAGRCVGDPLDASVEPDVPTFFDGGPDGGGCGSMRWPGRPAPGTEGEDTATRVWALKDIVYDQRDARWATIGWDLDGVCTESVVDFHPCTPPGEPVPPLDGRDGIDNAFGESVLGQMMMFESAFEARARQRMEDGESILLIVRGWNGGDEDPRVQATLVRGLGVNRSDGALPEWDGEDRWIQAETSFAGGNPDNPLIFNDNAYVSGRTLVFQMPDRRSILLPWVNENRFDLHLIDARFTATISADGTELEHALLTGRYPQVELPVALQNAGICEGSASRALVDEALDDRLDVRDPVGSGTGPGVVCNAISLALEMTGYAAELDVIESPPAPAPVDCLP